MMLLYNIVLLPLQRGHPEFGRHSYRDNSKGSSDF